MKIVAREFKESFGPWALVAGAAEGIGAAFAEALAEVGLGLVLVDRKAQELQSTASKLRQRYPIEVKEVVVDLADQNFLDRITAATKDLEIGLLIANAAIGEVGPFAESELRALLACVDVNVKAPLILTHTYGNEMIRRGKGGIILLASNAAYQGSPHVANYAATKAYNLVLGEGLWFEFASHGVDAMAFAPGATNTPALRKAKPELEEGKKNRGVMQPEDVAMAALAALGKTPSARPGLWSTLETFFMTRLLNRRHAVSLAGRFIERELKRTK